VLEADIETIAADDGEVAALDLGGVAAALGGGAESQLGVGLGEVGLEHDVDHPLIGAEAIG
jgi:hypothetical protein